MKKIIIILIIILIAGFGTWRLLSHSSENGGNQYAFAEIHRADIQSLVSSTGALQAVETVEVGTQVSGTIERIFVDFNDKVRKGQLIARLDTALLKVAVRDAEANVAGAQASDNEAQRGLKRNQSLFDKNLLPEKDYHQSLTNVEMSYASLLSAQTALERANINLNHAEIKSPIDGIVIERSVDEGQTVAASLSAPTLFVIAKDLYNMQILAQADESDIGQIREGQSARFTVPAYPDRVFEGQVQQIRLKPETVSNVVLYTVVVDAQNKDGLLLPGMTATVDFIVLDVHDVLCVSNAALRFQATEDMIAQLKKNQPPPMPAHPDSSSEAKQPRRTPGEAFAASKFDASALTKPSKDLTKLWVVDKDGSLNTITVRTGASNGTITEIVSSPQVKEGMRVISGIQPKNSKNDSQKSSSGSTARPGPRGPRLF